MENVLAMIYAEKAMILLRNDGKQITIENMEKEINKLFKTDQKVVMAYIKVALYNLMNSPNEINFKNVEMELTTLNDMYTSEGIIKRAKEIKI